MSVTAFPALPAISLTSNALPGILPSHRSQSVEILVHFLIQWSLYLLCKGLIDDCNLLSAPQKSSPELFYYNVIKYF
jgi:hypothetical protein